MHFVYYVDLVTQQVGGIVHPFLEFVHVVDAPVARLVDFNDIERYAFADGEAGLTPVAGLPLNGAPAVDRFSQYAGGAGLTAAARTAEKVGVRNPAAFYCVAESLDYVLLTCHLGKRLGPPFTVENLGGHNSPNYTPSALAAKINLFHLRSQICNAMVAVLCYNHALHMFNRSKSIGQGKEASGNEELRAP